MSDKQTKELIKLVGISLITVNVFWIGLLPNYFMPPRYLHIKFYGLEYNLNLHKIMPYLQGLFTVKIIYDIKNA